jgi:uncharacterized membrane protein YhaH (DUF805 family)
MQASTMQPMNAAGGMIIVSGRPTNMMNPIDSLVTCFQKYVGFEGRASRSEYWWFFLLTFIASFIAGIIDAILFGIELTDPTPITWALQIGVLLPSLAVAVRRLHDIGKSGWYIFIALIPIAGIIILIVWYCSDGDHVSNMYGPVPTNIREGNSGTPYVIVQQPMQQQYQQPMQQQYQQPMQQQYQKPPPGL